MYYMLSDPMCIGIVSEGQNSGAEQKTGLNKIVSESYDLDRCYCKS